MPSLDLATRRWRGNVTWALFGPSVVLLVQIEALLLRFGAAVDGERDGLRRLKIRPTTPAEPGPYQRVTIYVLDNPGLAEESVLRDYLAGDAASMGAFRRSVRGVYRLTPKTQTATVGSSKEKAKILFEKEREMK